MSSSIAPGLFSHAAALYRKTRVSTANDVHLLVEVHDAAIACVLSPSAASDFAHPLLRAHALIAELQATLQPEHDVQLASELSSFYDAILQRIVEAYLQDEPAPLLSVAAALRELRSVWNRLGEQRLPVSPPLG
ncbi:MAG: flagellar export chaperone FliS [Polyangiales bacterium]